MSGSSEKSDERGLPDQVLLEASDWHLRLQEAPDDLELRARFKAWLHAASSHQAAWRLLERTVRITKQTVPVHQADWHAPLVDASPPAAALRSRVRARRPRPRTAKRAALGAVAAALVAIVTGPQLLLQLRADNRSGTAKIENVALEDGSQVVLSAQSAITQDIAPDRRRIGLLEGEAWFDVAHDPSRPFTVAVADMTVTVIGTAFDVAQTDETLEVSVARGSVRVERAGQKPLAFALKPEQRLSVDRKSGKASMLSVSPLEIAAWRKGRLPVRNASMAEVVEVLDRHFAGRIVLRSDALKARRVTGVYDLADPVGSLQTLLNASGAKMTRITPWLIVVSDA